MGSRAALELALWNTLAGLANPQYEQCETKVDQLCLARALTR